MLEAPQPPSEILGGGLRVVAADHRPHPQDIVTAAHCLDIDIVIPAMDLTTTLLASLPDLRSSARLETPRAASYETLSDKARLLELANGLGISAPITRTASTAATVVNTALDE